MSSSRFVGGLLLGGAIGTIIGLLTAPRKGEETRQMLQQSVTEQVHHSIDLMQTQTHDIADKTTDALHELRAKSQAIAQELESAGRSALEKVRNNRQSVLPPADSPN